MLNKGCHNSDLTISIFQNIYYCWIRKVIVVSFFDRKYTHVRYLLCAAKYKKFVLVQVRKVRYVLWNDIRNLMSEKLHKSNIAE